MEEVEMDANKPLCPYCAKNLVAAEKNYMYNKITPDTRWFWCASCEIHYGYDRVKARWNTDPRDGEKLQEMILQDKNN